MLDEKNEMKMVFAPQVKTMFKQMLTDFVDDFLLNIEQFDDFEDDVIKFIDLWVDRKIEPVNVNELEISIDPDDKILFEKFKNYKGVKHENS